VSDTPRTLQEQCYGTCYAACERIEQLEHALATANTQIGLLVSGSKQQERQIEFLQAKIHRLTEAGNALLKVVRALLKVVREDEGLSSTDWVDLVRDAETSWTKAKEGL